MPLDPHHQSQQAAIDAIRAHALRGRSEARARVRALLSRHHITQRVYDLAIASTQRCVQIALHFHPERVGRTGRSVAQGLLETGVYKNQFETGVSSGSPTAFPGGERDRWERDLFAGAYHAPDTSTPARPKYGSLHLIPHPDGPSPRFGSCYLLLKPEMTERSTFTFGGSQESNAAEQSGTRDLLDPVMASLLAGLERDPLMLGPVELGIAEFLDTLANLGRARATFETLHLGRILDHFVEAQVHADIGLANHVDRLVADAAFQDHEVGDVLRALSQKYQFDLYWHSGFRLPLAEVPPVFRGYALKELASRAAVNGAIDAAALGACANSFELEPSAWMGWGPYDEMLTRLRRLWHVLVLGHVTALDQSGPVR